MLSTASISVRHAAFDGNSPETAARAAQSVRPHLELAGLLLLLEFDLWVLRAVNSAAVHVPVFAAMVAVLCSSLIRRRGAVVLGANRMSAVRAWLAAGAFTIVAAGLLIGGMWLVRDRGEAFLLRFEPMNTTRRLSWLFNRFVAAAVQQLAVQLFLWPVCSEIVRGRRLAMVVAAAIFSLLHLPQPFLVAITFLLGLVWIEIYARSGRVVPLIASHTLIATLAAGFMPNAVISSMAIGIDALDDVERFRYLTNSKVREVQRIVGSPEYFAACRGQHAEFVHGLYRDLLDRKPTPFELRRRVDQLNYLTRAEIARRIMNSNEFEQESHLGIERVLSRGSIAAGRNTQNLH